MTIVGSIRTVWPPIQHGGRFVIIMRDDAGFTRHRLWARDAWLASLCERYAVSSGRPTVTVICDARGQITSVALPVTHAEARG